jgi:hypothetical protein
VGSRTDLRVDAQASDSAIPEAGEEEGMMIGNERRKVLEEIDALRKSCVGCMKPPGGSKDRINTWCQRNCQTAQQIAAAGLRLDEVARAERSERRSKQKNEPDDWYSSSSLIKH